MLDSRTHRRLRRRQSLRCPREGTFPGNRDERAKLCQSNLHTLPRNRISPISICGHFLDQHQRIQIATANHSLAPIAVFVDVLAAQAGYGKEVVQPSWDEYSCKLLVMATGVTSQPMSRSNLIICVYPYFNATNRVLKAACGGCRTKPGRHAANHQGATAKSQSSVKARSP